MLYRLAAFQVGLHGSNGLLQGQATTIQNAEKILVLTENGIEESGSHEELLAQGGIYEKLYHMH